MPADAPAHVIGVDPDRDSVTASVVEASTTAEVAAAAFTASRGGYVQLLEWADRHTSTEQRTWAIEGAGGYGAGLAGHLNDAGERVVEFGDPRSAATRDGAKTDALDARRAAREVLGQREPCIPRARGRREALRVLDTTRRGAQRARVAAICELKALLVTAPVDLRDQLRGLTTAALVAKCSALRPPQSPDEELAATKQALRSIARRIKTLTEETDQLEAAIRPLISAAAPQLLDQPGVGPITAAQIADARVMTLRAAARRHGLGWHLINGVVKAWSAALAEHRRSRRCRVLLVDETSMRKRHRYVTVIVNGATGKTLAMVQHHSSAALSTFLMQQGHRWCKGVKVVVSDGSKAYKAAIGAHLGHARHVLDRFHVIRWFTAGLTAVRRDVQRRPEGSKPAFEPEVFRARFALLRRGDTLTDADRARLDALFDAHPRLRAGWQALQEVHGLYLADDYDGALEALGRFCDLYETGELPEFHDTHTGGALSVGPGLTLSTTGPSGAFTMICRPGPAGGARTDRSGGRDLIGALS